MEKVVVMGLLVGLQRGALTLEDSLASAYKTPDVLITQCSNHTLGVYLRETKAYMQKLCPNMHSSFIYWVLKPQAIQMSFHK